LLDLRESWALRSAGFGGEPDFEERWVWANAPDIRLPMNIGYFQVTCIF